MYAEPRTSSLSATGCWWSKLIDIIVSELSDIPLSPILYHSPTLAMMTHGISSALDWAVTDVRMMRTRKMDNRILSLDTFAYPRTELIQYLSAGRMKGNRCRSVQVVRTAERPLSKLDTSVHWSTAPDWAPCLWRQSGSLTVEEWWSQSRTWARSVAHSFPVPELGPPNPVWGGLLGPVRILRYQLAFFNHRRENALSLLNH